jgi:soluble lytic murein transglycosylase
MRSHAISAVIGVIGGMILVGFVVAMAGAYKEEKVPEHILRQTEMNKLKNELHGLRADIHDLSAAVSTRHQEDIVFLKILWLNRKVPHKLAKEIARLVCMYAKLYDRDTDLVLAIINHESDFDPKAKSKIGYPARGLMQIMPHWKKVHDIKGSLHDPETSIRYGLLILGSYEEMYHDLETAIIIYNRGPSPVDWDLIKGKNPANKYMRDIMGTYKRLQKLRVD